MDSEHDFPQDPRLAGSNKIVGQLSALLERANDFHHRGAVLLSELSAAIQTSALTQPELADAGFLCREIADTLNEVRKSFTGRMELASKVLATRLVEASVKGATEDKVEGKLCSATADLKMEASIPKSGTPEYAALMGYLGVDMKLIDSQLLRVDWNHFSTYLTQRAEDGKPKPPGIGAQWPRYTCVYVRKRRKS